MRQIFPSSRQLFRLASREGGSVPHLAVATTAAASLGMPGDSNGTIAYTEARIAYTDACLASPHPAPSLSRHWETEPRGRRWSV